jgi:phosphate ABC transporter permease protein PstC
MNSSDFLPCLLTFALLCAGGAFFCVIIFFMAVDAAPALFGQSGVSLADFLFLKPWRPWDNPPVLGILHAWLSTLMVAGIALSIAFPLGLGLALFLSELAPLPMEAALRPCLDLLAGIPSVVYGFFGYVTLVKSFENWFAMPTGECVGVAGIILAIMILPFIASMAMDALRSVPGELREASLSLGITRPHMVRRVLLAAASPGIFAAAGLGLARAMGETLAVLMLAGNANITPTGFLSLGQPVTALLATELGETAVGSIKYHTLFMSGMFLLFLVAVLNALIWKVKKRFSHAG